MARRYYRHKIENLIQIKKIISVHYFNFDKDYIFAGETHDFWEIVYAAKSSVICQSENRVIHLKEGNILFHKPDEFHSIRGNQKTPSEVFVMTFECSSQAARFFENKMFFLHQKMREYIFTIIYEAKKTFDLPRFDPYLNKLKLLNNPNLGGQQMIRLNLEQLLILLMREYSSTGSEEIFLPAGHIAAQMIEYLKENVYNKINLNDICKKFYYGKTYLCTSFKKSTGTTIFDYYNKLKINEAKKLFKKGVNLKETYTMLGFDSQSYFTTVFKKYENISPKQYIKQNAI